MFFSFSSLRPAFSGSGLALLPPAKRPTLLSRPLAESAGRFILRPEIASQ